MAKIINPGPPVSQEEISLLEKELAIDLPESYTEFLLQTNGGEPSPDEFIVPRWEGEASAVSFFFSISGDKGAGLKSEILSFKARIPDSIIPIGTDPGGNLICIGIDDANRGKVYFWDHEDELDENGESKLDFSNTYLVAGSFDEFLENLTDDAS